MLVPGNGRDRSGILLTIARDQRMKTMMMMVSDFDLCTLQKNFAREQTVCSSKESDFSAADDKI